MTEVAYTCWSAGTPRPFYYYTKTKQVSWTRRNACSFRDPPDGFHVDPPQISRGRSDFSKTITGFSGLKSIQESQSRGINLSLSLSSMKRRVVQSSRRKPKDPQAAEDDNGFLDSNFSLPAKSEFFSVPYYPSDLFILMKGDAVKRYLVSHFSEMKKANVKGKEKVKYKPEAIVNPNKKAFSACLLKTTPQELAKLAGSLFKKIKRFIETADTEYVFDIFQLIDGNPKLRNEAAVFIMTETNSIVPSQRVLNTWKLFEIFTARYRVDPELNVVVRSYCAVVAGWPQCPVMIRDPAMVCLFRLSVQAPFNLKFDVDSQSSYLKTVTSSIDPFGPSLSELLYREREMRKDDILVPSIFIKLIKKLKDCNAVNTPNLFRRLDQWAQKKGKEGKWFAEATTKADKHRLIQDLRRGCDGMSVESAYTVAAVIKYFLRHIQEPLIPTNMLHDFGMTMQSHTCVSIANSLPNAHRDTLKYFVGFLQEYTEKQIRQPGITVAHVAESVCMVLSRPGMLVGVKEVLRSKYDLAFRRFLVCLIEDWRTDDVYKRD